MRVLGPASASQDTGTGSLPSACVNGPGPGSGEQPHPRPPQEGDGWLVCLGWCASYLGPPLPPRPSPSREHPGSFPLRTRLPPSCPPPERCMELENCIKASCFLGKREELGALGGLGCGAVWPTLDTTLGFRRARCEEWLGVGSPRCACVHVAGAAWGQQEQGSPVSGQQASTLLCSCPWCSLNTDLASTRGCENKGGHAGQFLSCGCRELGRDCLALTPSQEGRCVRRHTWRWTCGVCLVGLRITCTTAPPGSPEQYRRCVSCVLTNRVLCKHLETGRFPQLDGEPFGKV